MIANLDAVLFLGLQGIFFLTALVFVIFSIVLSYHWFTYGSSKHLSMLSLAVYLAGSAPFFLIMSLALTMM